MTTIGDKFKNKQTQQVNNTTNPVQPQRSNTGNSAVDTQPLQELLGRTRANTSSRTVTSNEQADSDGEEMPVIDFMNEQMEEVQAFDKAMAEASQNSTKSPLDVREAQILAQIAQLNQELRQAIDETPTLDQVTPGFVSPERRAGNAKQSKIRQKIEALQRELEIIQEVRKSRQGPFGIGNSGPSPYDAQEERLLKELSELTQQKLAAIDKTPTLDQETPGFVSPERRAGNAEQSKIEQKIQSILQELAMIRQLRGGGLPF